LRELFAAVPEEAAGMLPALSYILIEPARLSPEALDQPDNLAATFFRIETAQAPEELLSLPRSIARMLPDDEDAELRRAFIDLLVETLRTAFPEVIIPPIEDLEELSMLGENMIRWHNSVQREAREEGRVEGMQRLLIKQLKLRFGPLPLPVRRQVREISSVAELENLAGRLLTASSLADLGLSGSQVRKR
jgi:hypothetical protein